jgi:hypothetical protein
VEDIALATLKAADSEDIRRLLELFPVSLIKSNWDHLRGNKTDLCEAISLEADLRKIGTFVALNFARCKLHTYILGPRGEEQPGPESVFPSADFLRSDSAQRKVYLAKAKYTVLLAEPFRQEELELLWPLRVEYREEITLLSFIVLERDVRAFFDREPINVRRHLEEKDVLNSVTSLGYQPVDLNKGVKALWSEDFMDAFRSKFKKTRSTTTEAMDKELGIKATTPRLYEQMLRFPMFETMFRINHPADSAVRVFQVNPTSGNVRMTRYTEGLGDSDEIVQRILTKNF